MEQDIHNNTTTTAITMVYCKNSLGSVTKPVNADAAAVYGDAKYI